MRWVTDWERRARSLMEYSMVMSPYPLALDGKSYVLMLTRTGGLIHGGFLDLSRGDGIPRCMHAWKLSKKAQSEIRQLYVPGTDGMYPEHVTTWD
jgi:hypothetical protein